VYARQIGDRLLTFGVSGMLFRDALVMYDRETDTLWTQVNGLGIKGPLAGQTLETVPSILATWKQWKHLYPDSQVLKKRGPPGSSYASYNRDPNKLGIMGRRIRDKRLPNKERILGVRAGDAAMAFAEKDVREARLVHANVGALPVVLVAPTPAHPIVVFDRRAGGRLLSFRFVDGEPTLVEDAQPVVAGRRACRRGAARGHPARAGARLRGVLVRLAGILPTYRRVDACRDAQRHAMTRWTVSSDRHGA
jgi:hypothetical protein